MASQGINCKPGDALTVTIAVNGQAIILLEATLRDDGANKVSPNSLRWLSYGMLMDALQRLTVEEAEPEPTPNPFKVVPKDPL